MKMSAEQGGNEMSFFDLFKKKQRKTYSDGVLIEYEIEPPHFRTPIADEFGIADACGSCKFCGNIRSEWPVCTKYGVRYHGIGCLAKTVCDDFENVLFDLL